jgi:hypothetical protein
MCLLRGTTRILIYYLILNLFSYFRFFNIIEEITPNLTLILYIRITVLARTSSNLAVSPSFTTPKVVRQKNTIMNPAGSETKSDCVAEDHRQITALASKG